MKRDIVFDDDEHRAAWVAAVAIVLMVIGLAASIGTLEGCP